MRSEIVNRNYAQLWPLVVTATFRVEAERDKAMALLASYHGPEPDRVRLGILKAASCNLAQMAILLDIAQHDWRDLLCAAEYPLSSQHWGLRENAPEKYDVLLANEQEQYEQWLRLVLAT